MSRGRERQLSSGGSTLTVWRPIERPPDHQDCGSVHVGPHNRCTHATAPPPGYRFCGGEHGCPVRLPDVWPHARCPGCAGSSADPEPNGEWDKLMGGRL